MQANRDPWQLGIAELPPQGNRFCLLIYPAIKKQGSAKWIHIHKHTEESELKPKYKENKNSWDQRAAWEKEMGVILGAMGATLEVREWEEVLHKVRHGTYTTEEHSNRHEGHKTHNGQVTDHTAWTKCDMTTCCRVGPIQSLLQQSRGKKARTLPT